MMDFELLLFDRLEKIRSINKQYDLLNKAYLSFSGGKDSTILHYLLDIALPENKIPRVFIDTGIEYKMIVDFIKQMQKNDERIIIIKPSNNIKTMLEQYGYPFKSKQHSHNVSIYQNQGKLTKSTIMYLDIKAPLYKCPDILRYQFTDENKLKISEKCCDKLKKRACS